MKFPFKKTNRTALWEQFDEINSDLIEKFMAGIPEGKKMEMFIREEIVWDAEQMKKYFEGPVVDFVQQCYSHDGNAIGKGVVREGLKGMFIGWTEPNQFGQVFPLSRTELDKPKDGKSPRKRWKEFLTAINDYCMQRWGYPLPTYENTEAGE